MGKRDKRQRGQKRAQKTAKRRTSKKEKGAEGPRIAPLSREELEAAIARAEAGEATTEDFVNLRAAIGTLTWLTDELASQHARLARLRAGLGLNSEKTRDVVGDAGSSAESQDADKKQKEGDAESSDEAQEPADDDKPAAGRSDETPPGHGRNGADAYTGAEIVKVEHTDLKAGDACPGCKKGKLYPRRDRPRLLVRVTGQAPIKATVYEQDVLRCNLCGLEFAAPLPEGVGTEKYDAPAAAMIALLRYGSGLPFNRLERLEGNLGIPLPASVQWEIVSDAAEVCRPAYLELVHQAAQAERLYNDDTSVKILDLVKENQFRKDSGAAEKGARTGIFTTGVVAETDGRTIGLFFTGRNHAGENLDALLKERAAELSPPIQMCDALDRNVPKGAKTDLANCLVHGRRHFVPLAENFPAECRHVLEQIGEVYKYDREAREQQLTGDERLAHHKEHSGPIMKHLKAWMESQFAERNVEPNSPLGQAMNYMLKRWKKLTLFLRKPGAPLDSNIVERALKRAILHRKNSLFYKTLNGAHVGDLFMSLIHTADLAGANAFAYLQALIQHPEEARQDPAAWMPWNYTTALERAADNASPA